MGHLIAFDLQVTATQNLVVDGNERFEQVSFPYECLYCICPILSCEAQQL